MARPSGTRERIQAVAHELFLQQGVRNTSLRQISDRLGITKPALYYHFASRDELVRSIIQPLVDDTEAFLAGRAAGDPRRLLEDYFDLLWEHRGVLIMVLRDPTTLVYLNLDGRVLRWRRRLTGLLVGPEPSARTLIHATVALGGMSDCAVEHGDRPFDEVKPAAVEAALAALAAGRLSP